MKLISNIHDYYDGAIQYSEDVLFDRMNLVEIVNNYQSRNKFKKAKQLVCGGNLILGFCGKLYPFVIDDYNVLYFKNQKDIEIVKKIYDARRENRIYLGNSELKIFLMAAGVLAFSGYVGYDDKMHVVEDDSIFLEYGVSSFVYYNSEYEYTDERAHPLGTNQNIPILVDKNNNRLPRGILIKNPILRDFGFNRIVDPYTATQEIEMYLGKIAANNTPKMPVGSDKVIAESKGYDEWSFRKMPTKKKVQ